MIEREDKVKHSFKLPGSLSRRLRALTLEPGSSQTQIVIDALVSFLDHGAGAELDQRYVIRLDRMTSQLNRIERRANFISEALGLFIQHELTAKAHEPPFEPATAHLGRHRYEAFLQLVWQRMGPSARSQMDYAPAEHSADSTDG